MPVDRDDELEVSEVPIGAGFYWCGRPVTLLERRLVPRRRGRWSDVVLTVELADGERRRLGYVPGELVRLVAHGAASVS